MATIICETESETDLLQMVYGQLSHWMFFSKSPLNFLLYLNLKTVLITPLNNRADKDLWSVDCALNTEITSGKFLFFFFFLLESTLPSPTSANTAPYNRWSLVQLTLSLSISDQCFVCINRDRLFGYSFFFLLPNPTL